MAAVAATRAIQKKLMSGIVSPMNDIAVHVGGAKAGRRLSRKTMMNSKTVILVKSANPITASQKVGREEPHTYSRQCASEEEVEAGDSKKDNCLGFFSLLHSG